MKWEEATHGQDFYKSALPIAPEGLNEAVPFISLSLRLAQACNAGFGTWDHNLPPSPSLSMALVTPFQWQIAVCMLWAGSHSVDGWGNSAWKEILSITFHWESRFISKNINSYKQKAPTQTKTLNPTKPHEVTTSSPKLTRVLKSPRFPHLSFLSCFSQEWLSFPQHWSKLSTVVSFTS